MARRHVQVLAAGALATALTATSATSASAERWWGGERTGDVTELAYTPEPPPCGTLERSASPRDADTDLAGLSVRHAGGTVEVRVHLRDLTGWGRRSVDVSLQTPQRAYVVDVARDPAKQPRGNVLWDASQAPTQDECGSSAIWFGEVPCPDLSMSRSTARDHVSVVVPRSCLGWPRWVRAGATTSRWTDGQFRTDTWRDARATRRTDSGLLASLGPRVRHG